MREALGGVATFRIWSVEEYDPSVRRAYRAGPDDGLVWAAGDYNGDGIQDLTVTGVKQGKPVVLALVSRGTSFRVVTVIGGPVTPDDTAGAPRTLTLRHADAPAGEVGPDAVLISFRDKNWPGRPPELYFWRSDRFYIWAPD